jgi:hypothetical protein
MKYAFRNQTSATIILIVEPWAKEFSVPSGSVVSIQISSSSSEVPLLETFIDEKYVTIWLLGGCRAEVSLDDKKQIRPFLSNPVP